MQKKGVVLKHRKAQAAFELMGTYGIHIILAALALGAFYYFGFTDIEVQSNTCLTPAGFGCKDVRAYEDGIELVLTNSQGERVGIERIEIEDCVSFVPNADDQNFRSGEATKFTIPFCTTTEKQQLQGNITYTKRGGFTHTAAIELRLDPDNSVGAAPEQAFECTPSPHPDFPLLTAYRDSLGNYYEYKPAMSTVFTAVGFSGGQTTIYHDLSNGPTDEFGVFAIEVNGATDGSSNDILDLFEATADITSCDGDPVFIGEGAQYIYASDTDEGPPITHSGPSFGSYNLDLQVYRIIEDQSGPYGCNAVHNVMVDIPICSQFHPGPVYVSTTNRYTEYHPQLEARVISTQYPGPFGYTYFNVEITNSGSAVFGNWFVEIDFPKDLPPGFLNLMQPLSCDGDWAQSFSGAIPPGTMVIAIGGGPGDFSYLQDDLELTIGHLLGPVNGFCI